MNTLHHKHIAHRGSTLIISLVFLLILSVIAINQMSSNSMLTRIASNSGDAMVAFQTAEGALNQAANALLGNNLSIDGFLANTNGLYLFSPTSSALWSSINWASSSAVVQSYQGSAKVAAAYFIEQMPSITVPGQSMTSPISIYRITARAVGASGGTPVILQAVVQVPQY